MKIKIAGRYFRPELASLFQRLHSAGKDSKIKTKTERVLAYIRYSLGHDFREGFRSRDHGQDAYQIATRELDSLEPIAVEESREQEAEYLRECVEAAREFIQSAERRSATSQGDGC